MRCTQRRRPRPPAAGRQVLRQDARAGRARPVAACGARCWPCSAPTAPARAPRSACCWACCAPTAARSSCSASDPRAIGRAPADRGDAAVRGHPRHPARRRAARPQPRSYYPTPRSVADCVALAGLDGLLDRAYGRLSGGQQRRVQFAHRDLRRSASCCSSTSRPPAWTSMRASRMWATIRELVAQGTGVLLTTHYLEEAEALADRVVVLRSRPGRRRRQRAGGPRAWSRSAASAALSSLDADGSRPGPACAAQPRPRRRSGCASSPRPPSRWCVACLRRIPTCSDLEIQRAGLADAFLELTRDDADSDAADRRSTHERHARLAMSTDRPRRRAFVAGAAIVLEAKYECPAPAAHAVVRAAVAVCFPCCSICCSACC